LGIISIVIVYEKLTCHIQTQIISKTSIEELPHGKLDWQIWDEEIL
jgi:hypothetical protein